MTDDLLHLLRPRSDLPMVPDEYVTSYAVSRNVTRFFDHRARNPNCCHEEKHNATEGTDEITRDDESWADAVVVIYEWDDDGVQRREYDFAGDPDGKCVTITHQREFPGPGAAAYILARLQGRGRTQEVTALTKYTATPGQDALINLPGTLAQSGKLRQVIFDLKSGLMDLGTRGLTDALPGSWALWDPEETWAEVDPDLTWMEA